MFDITTYINSMKLAMDQMSSILKAYGVELNLHHIKINEEDNTIDFVYRLSCSDEILCKMLIDELKKQSEEEKKENE